MTSDPLVNEPCTICGNAEDEHDAMNHQYNLNHELITKVRSTPAKQRRQTNQIMVVGAMDTDLRRILLDKGIITGEDFAALRDPGTGPAGDRATGQAEGS